MSAPTEQKKKPRRPVKERNADYYLRVKMAILMGTWGFIAFFVFSIAFSVGGNHPLSIIFRIIAFTSPVIGWFFAPLIDVGLKKTIGQIFWPDTGHTARAHSEGEALFQRQQYEEAVEWFTEAVARDPDDWKAQQRIVEILTNQIHDVERAAQARNRLLKIEGLGSGLWVETALRLGRDWEDLDRPDRAINIYKSLLWRYSEGYDADAVRQRLAELGAQFE
jgi:tetratricopeptide (TPR) repeat protein